MNSPNESVKFNQIDHHVGPACSEDPWVWRAGLRPSGSSGIGKVPGLLQTSAGRFREVLGTQRRRQGQPQLPSGSSTEASIPRGKLKTLKANPMVASIDEDVLFSGTINFGKTPIYPEVASNGALGHEVKVTIMDASIDLEHPDLKIVGDVSFSATKTILL